MKLETLEIHGFKSFADRTRMDFNPGITAIVGPNGCGKTNITDAIRWVLGEQRPTALRGSSMQEVIFNGTRERKPLGLAEVTLSFGNALGLIPVEYAEVSVTRRVFRDGESEYLLNRAACNLKDIRDLFMGTGIGSSVYSLIEQKMVDAILSDRADERRVLFEEAAGVTRYKSRRKATERKLEATEEDLRRLSDILSEVRKTTNALRRQMGRARRFKVLQREELRLAVSLARAELAELAGRETPLRGSIAGLEAELGRGAADSAEREAAVELLDRALAERRLEERALRERVGTVSAGVAALERERMLADEGRRHAALEVERLGRAIGEHRSQARALLASRDGLTGQLEAALCEAETARTEAGDRGSVVAGLTRDFEEAQVRLREARAERERRSEQWLRMQAELARSTAERQAAVDRRSELEASLSALRAACGAGPDPAGAIEGGPATEPVWLEGPWGMVETGSSPVEDASPRTAGDARDQALEERVRELRSGLASAEEGLGSAVERRTQTEALISALEQELTELETRRREVTARLDTLEELEQGFAGFGEGARRALEARHAIAPGLRGPLGIEVEVAEPRYAPAVDAYLDLFLDALLTTEADEARAVLDFWRERNQIGAVWPLADAPRVPQPPIHPDALELLLCRGTQAASLRGDLDRHRDALFGRLLLAEDLDRAAELRRRLNGNGSAGWYVVAALSGEILEPSGLVRLPHRKSEGAGVSRFHQAENLKGVLGELLREARRLEERIGEARDGLSEARARETAAAETAAARAAEAERLERDLERSRDARRAARDRAGEIEAEIAVVAEREAREARIAREASSRAKEIQSALEAAAADLEGHEEWVESLRVGREAALVELGGAELAAQQRAASLAALEREGRYLDEAALEQERAAAADEAELARQRDRIATLEGEAARVAGAAEEARGELAARREEHRSLEASALALEVERSAREGDARAARRVHEEASQRLHVEEMRLAELLHRRESIHAILETEFGHPVPELVRWAEAPPREAERAGDAETEVVEEPAGGERAAGLEGPLEDGPAVVADAPVAAQAAGPRSDDRAARVPLPEGTIEELRELLRGVRERKSSLGPVNLLALEEFGTEKERLDFLEAQYADLVKAREDLRQAIRKINATARELFVETFTHARGNFRTTFGTLFEGGHADIALADEDDPLESPIEITASPRGKRVQAVNLLSGGERALTALSLLFAIYLVKPSPFCILDEVDAPLDDANIGRFLRMIRSFSERTQFIVVTHNKRTMEASDFLYGVTMEEPGVSTLVSVDFERRHTFDYDAIAYRGGPSAPEPEEPDVADALEAADRGALLVGD